MTQFETEIQDVKSEVINMWELVLLQLSKAKEAMLNFDKDLAREVILKEKRVNALELKIDRDCENIFALYCPVAIDLRFLLAALKINNNLERIGDTYIKENLNNITEALYILSIIRKLERVGDQSKNIAEEIIFYVEAKVLKHQ
jgi:phosphate uptake regulator